MATQKLKVFQTQVGKCNFAEGTSFKLYRLSMILFRELVCFVYFQTKDARKDWLEELVSYREIPVHVCEI